MEHALIQEIASTLGINKYSIESEDDYVGRVVFAAIVEWGRMLVLSDTDSGLRNRNYHMVDKTYLNYRLSKIAEGYKNIFECNYLRIFREEYSVFAKRIIQDMIKYYQISELIEKRKVSNSPLCYIKIDEKNTLVNGLYEKEAKCIGFGKWINKDIEKYDYEYREFFNISKYNFNDYFNSYCNVIDDWEPIENLKNYKMELLERESDEIFYKKISFENILELEPNYYILKQQYLENSVWYVYSATENSRTISVVGSEMNKTREISRLIYSYKAVHGNKIKIYKKEYDDCVVISLLNYLPCPEQELINMSTWGRSYYCDSEKIVPKSLWKIIENVLFDLGLEILNK